MKKQLHRKPFPIFRVALFTTIISLCLVNVLLANDKYPAPDGTRKITIGYEHMHYADTTIKGKITDGTGAPLAGVNVLEKGTNNGVISDKDGNYSISVSNPASILVVSYVGYTPREIGIGEGTDNISIQSTSGQLDDVVVVGYGTQRRSELTNAVVQTTGAELKKSTALSVSNSLAGRLPGLFVSQTSAAPGFDDAKILVRGPKTFRNSSALIVIDGVANADPDGLNRIDPNDIESISVLKDASAAIYGAQSAGGVILVTTKRGKAGKTAFDYSSTFSWQTPTMKTRSADVFEYMKVLNDRRKLEGTPPDFPDALVQSFRDGTRRPEDWYDALVDGPAKQSRHSLTMRGGTDKVRYFLSVGAAGQGGILRGDDKTKLRQYNVRSNVDVSVTKNFEVGLDISVREKNTETPQSNPGGDVSQFATVSPLQEAYIGGDYRYPGEGWSQSNPAARLLSPGYRRYKADVLSGTIRFKYNLPFVKGLALDGFSSLVKVVNYNKIFNYTWFYYERDPAGEVVKKPSRTVEDIGLREEFGQTQRLTNNLKLSYATTINEDHKINVFVAYEQMEYKDNSFNTQRLGFESPNIDQLFAGSTDRANFNNDGRASETARRNYFGRASYDYKGKYLLGFSARYDGSPIFPKDSRFGFFPQASVGWVLSNEPFMPKVFSTAKLRASWGQLGNDRVDPFQYIGAFGYSSGYVVNGVDVRGISATSTPNPNITWEVSESTDLGLELGFLENRLTFEGDVHQTKTKNILARRQASIPAYTGLVLPDENIGKMDSRGFEVQAGYRQNIGRVGVRVSANYAYSENKIIFLDETPQSEPYQKREGNPLGSGLVYKAIGIYRSADDLAKNVNYSGAKVGGLIFADLNGDGKVDGNDRYMFSPTIVNEADGTISVYPKAQFGFTVGADYEAFDLSILLQGQSGAKWRLSNGFNSGAAGNGLKYVANNSYSLENVNAELPMIAPTGVGAENSDFYYHKSTWMRMKNIQLGYTLPNKWVSRAKIVALRFYASGDNLFMVYNNLEKYGAGDPEFLSGNGGVYPNMRNFSVGVNVTF